MHSLAYKTSLLKENNIKILENHYYIINTINDKHKGGSYLNYWVFELHDIYHPYL